MAIMVALLFPALLGLGVLAVDVGNWYLHKRELQTQADAAALAGAAYFKYPCDNAPISTTAQSYAGKDHNAFGNVPTARSTFLLKLYARYMKEGIYMPFDLDLYARELRQELFEEYGKEFLESLSAEKRLEMLQTLPAEKRLEGLSAEDLLKSLSPEVRDALFRKLKDNEAS